MHNFNLFDTSLCLSLSLSLPLNIDESNSGIKVYCNMSKK
jgi:hypothetical protein